MLQTLQKEIEGTVLTFTNQRALYWEEERVLVLSDLHVGKAAHFRKHGIAISSDILHEDLLRMETLIGHFNPVRILIVGDLFHAGYNSDLNLFKEWRLSFTQDFLLISGNHDRLSKAQYLDLGIHNVIEQLVIGPFTFVHHPTIIVANHFYISGHIHPGFVLEGKHERLRLPCFAVSDQQVVLPAFSRFTGLDTKTLKGDFKHLVFTEDAIFEI